MGMGVKFRVAKQAIRFFLRANEGYNHICYALDHVILPV